MKKNFKKSLAVLLVAMMLFSVISVSVFAATYTVTFQATSNADKGQTQTATRTFSKKGEVIILPTKEELTFTREGYDHIGWSTGSTGSTKHGDFGAEYTTTKAANYKMYPAWKAKVFKVTYTAGAFGVGEDVVVDATYNKSIKISDALFTREGYTQVGWATTEGGAKVYDLGAKYTANEGATLYPVWADKVYTVTVVGGAANSNNNTAGSKVTITASPAVNQLFVNWEVVSGNVTFDPSGGINLRVDGVKHIGFLYLIVC